MSDASRPRASAWRAVVRGGARVLRFAAGTAALYAWQTATVATLKLLGREAAPRKARLFRAWARFSLRTLALDVTVSGLPPRAPFLLVSNHLSYLDVVVLGAHLDAVFVARADVESWPLFGRLCRAGETIFIDRGRRKDVSRVLERIECILRQGRGVVLFPEGTSTDGSAVGPFHPSLLEAAPRLGRPVHHAALTYETPAGSPPARNSVCWWGDMPFLPHLWGVVKLPHIRARLRFGEAPIEATDRKQLATLLRAAVSADFEPVSG